MKYLIILSLFIISCTKQEPCTQQVTCWKYGVSSYGMCYDPKTNSEIIQFIKCDYINIDETVSVCDSTGWKLVEMEKERVWIEGNPARKIVTDSIPTTCGCY